MLIYALAKKRKEKKEVERERTSRVGWSGFDLVKREGIFVLGRSAR
jgi:hypothetical protein